MLVLRHFSVCGMYKVVLSRDLMSHATQNVAEASLIMIINNRDLITN